MQLNHYESEGLSYELLGRKLFYVCAWNIGRSAMEVLRDRKLPVKQNVIRPALGFGADTLASMKRQERRVEVNETRMLLWMCGVMKKDETRNQHVRASVKVAPVKHKMRGKRLNWHGHVKRMDEGHVLRRMLDAPVPGKKWRGRQKAPWKTFVKEI